MDWNTALIRRLKVKRRIEVIEIKRHFWCSYAWPPNLSWRHGWEQENGKRHEAHTCTRLEPILNYVPDLL
jgi:hypothetical protein